MKSKYKWCPSEYMKLELATFEVCSIYEHWLHIILVWNTPHPSLL